MKSIQAIIAALLLASVGANAGVYYYNSSPNQTIPDDNPTGIQDSIVVNDISPAYDICKVLVYLNVSGGYNGDLYAYLNFGGSSGTSIVLLNRIGTAPWGSDTAGFGNSTHTYENGPGSGNWYNFLLTDSAGTDIHNATGTSGQPITGSYKPDGTSLSSFNVANPNQTWTIFFADMAVGGGSSASSLNGWGLEITTVPEPANIALGIFGASSMLVLVVRSRTVRSRVERVKTAWANWLDAA